MASSVSTVSIGALVDQLRRGELVVPVIQRSYVWRPPEVVSLLDSLVKRYPVGSLLIWDTSEDMPFRPLWLVDQTTEGPKTRRYLLDGQQRAVSVLIAMTKEEDDSRPRPAVDLLTCDFWVSRKRQHIEGSVESWEALDPSIPYTEVVARANIPSSSPNWSVAVENLMRIRNLNNHLIPVESIQEDDLERVADIFNRINKSGRRLTVGDLVFSGAVARWPWIDDAIRRLREEMDTSQAGWTVGKETTLRVLGLIAGAGIKQMDLVTNRRLDDKTIRDAWARTEEVLLQTADTCRNDIGLRWSGDAPPGMVTSIAWSLYVGIEDKETLRRWVIASMLFEDRHSRSTVEHEVRTLTKYPNEGGVERLVDRALGSNDRDPSESVPVKSVLRATYPGNSRFLGVSQALCLSNGANDWDQSGRMVDADEIDQHHIFPSQHINGMYDDALINSVANIAYVGGSANRDISSLPPSTYLPTISPKALAQQFVPSDPSLWKTENFLLFLHERAGLLSDAINDALGLPHDVGR